MAELRPFRAIHYNTERFGRDLSVLVAPPYDVLSERQRDDLASRSPHNIVHVDLPHFPPKSPGPDAAYAAAAKRLSEWLAEGVLQREPSARFYHYTQEFSHKGKRYRRHCLFAALRLSPFGSGEVYPHEETFGGAIADRLKLSQATGSQLSPVFGMVASGLYELLRRAVERPEQQWSAELDGVRHQVAAIHDEALTQELSDLLASQPVYIADGHHRYKTALAYRDWLAEKAGSLPEDHPANFIMIALAGMDDPGNLLLPTHRILHGLTPERLARLRSETSDLVEWHPLEAFDPQRADETLAAQPGKAFLFVSGEGRQAWLALQRRDELPADCAPQRSDAFRRLALAFLHSWLIDRVLAGQAAEPITIRYTPDAAEACAAVDPATTAVLVQPCTMAELMAVCQASDTMPPKSTYFYPKLATGLLLYRLTD